MGRDERANPFARAKAIDGIVDARGRKLDTGDEIILDVGGPIYFRVVGIKPALRPDAPAGMLQIEIAAAIHFYAPRGVPQREFIRVRTADECGPMTIKLADDADAPQTDAGAPPDGPKLVTP